MYDILVIKEGYTKPMKRGLLEAGGSITLLKGPKNIIVDTGSPWDKDLLLSGLQDHDLCPDKIDYVICTHGHSDHVGNLNLFPSSCLVVSYDICHRDRYTVHDFAQGIPFEIDDFVEIWPTPGHTGADVSVVVRGTQLGTVAVTGDLFEHLDDLEDPEIWQSTSERPELQQQSRIDILRVADYIVPGHGPMFKVPLEFRKQMRMVMMHDEYYEEASGEGITSTVSQSQCIIVETE
ncbi:hypothetical protein C0Q70_21156 [Pomacea canaliculata]|uniref:Metallo-beta-lactamase domain-containing protein 1 n=1 Tax=Pomacea canaliculata TaxID=400727 RepID=A0A2T7NBQ0_POMCA|nr:metallo-beta-lactamase domain-containing protein 1-like isoform X1 [Pomacea canaliculata]XP_025079327.1 metallo-beta-lactamase domain-containing protein 1-like isoform X1 [Pomacea canaliculata]XP_025079328.1 metallo-beta-lactamase domain-containing protein 1-like isoform X1 [Pomacea canaliculata]PVD18606.1 hypothetical protein C0Q70_21156 [Pomacea canaliculata]